MKRIFLILLVSVSIGSYSQSTFFKAVKLYYRVNPFDRKFSVMLNNILKDTSFVKMEMKKRTDSNFFFLSGYYKRFNPFDFTAIQTQVRLAESEIVVDEASKKTDTIIFYQLLGIAGPGEENKLKVQKELSRFHKRFRYDFSNSYYKQNIYDGMVISAVYYYSIEGRTMPVMSVAWGKMPGEDNYTFTVTLRLKIIENFAEPPKMPGEE